MVRRSAHLILALLLAMASLASLAPGRTLAAPIAAAAAPADLAASATNVVVYDPPRPISFVGPARFRGMKIRSDGSSYQAASYGTITPITFGAGRTAMLWGAPHARIANGPLAETWVRVNEALDRAIGHVPAPPACRYADVLTSRRSYKHHARTLLDTIYKVPSTYAPGDLIDSGGLALNSGYRVRSVIGTQLKAMARDARGAGVPIMVVSGYRSYAQQKATFDYWVSVGGYQQALLTSARAGHSEHQLGTTVDLTTYGGKAPWGYTDWAATPAGAWVKKNAWKYGFVMSYPKGETTATCYAYEPWHYRYVGTSIAAAVRGSGLTYREAIWAAYGP